MAVPAAMAWSLLLLVLLCMPQALSAYAPGELCAQEAAALASQQPLCDAACQLETRAALLQINAVLLAPSGLHWGNDSATDNGAPVNFTAGNCNREQQICTVSESVDLIPGDPTSFMFGADGAAPLPSYCCWRGVVCCTNANVTALRAACRPYSVIALILAHWPQKLNGTLGDILGSLVALDRHGLQRLDVSGNWLRGEIPQGIMRMTNIYDILLTDNYINGTIPRGWASLPHLSDLSLAFNLLKDNLTGVSFCPPGGGSRLLTLNLRANNLTGQLSARSCEKLLFLDAQDNLLTGGLPVGPTNLNLAILRLRNNLLSGAIEDEFWMLPNLFSVDLQNNKLTGTISDKINMSSYVINILFLGNNSLHGRIPEGLGTLTQLTKLDLSNNKGLWGQLPDMSGALGLQELKLQQTSLWGPLPLDLGGLPYLMDVDIRNTLMTCCGNQSAADSGPVLPPYLMFSPNVTQTPVQLPTQLFDPDRDAEGGGGAGDDDELDPGQFMQCPGIMRAPGFKPALTQVLVPGNLTLQQWRIDPEYYWFRGCGCLANYREEYGVRQTLLWANPFLTRAAGYPPVPMNILDCRPQGGILWWQKLIIVLTTGAVGALLILTGYFFCCRRASKPVRALRAVRKRAHGMPRRGRMSIVVTDIEGYSNMMNKAPELMYRALTMHNNIVRKAKWVNCGFTLEQEGDSYALVFYHPADAVGFCLQAQLMLNEAVWPPGLLDDGDPAGKEGSRGHARHIRKRGLLSLGDSRSGFFGGPGAEGGASAGGGGWFQRHRSGSRHGAGDSRSALATVRSKSLGEMSLSPPPMPAAGGAGAGALQPQHLQPPPNSATWGGALTPPAPGSAAGSFAAPSPPAAAAALASGDSAGGTAVAAGGASVGVSRARLFELMRGGGQGGGGGHERQLFNGLRVRMGVATGEVPSGAEIKNSVVFELAKAVSEAGNGGQVLMEQETFGGIRDMLHELGAIDASGLNYRKLSGKRTWLDVCCCMPPAEEEEAVVLDMGEYQTPLGHQAAPAAAAGGKAAQERVWQLPPRSPSLSIPRRHWPDGPFLPGALTGGLGGAGDGGLGDGGGGGGGGGGGSGTGRRGGARVRLVQVCAPPILARAKVFGNSLSLKEDWTCTDMPYFDAPAAQEAPLGTCAAALTFDRRRDGGGSAQSLSTAAAAAASGDDAAAAAGGQSDAAALAVRSQLVSSADSFKSLPASACPASPAASGSFSSAPPPPGPPSAAPHRAPPRLAAPPRGLGASLSAPLPDVTLVFASVDGAHGFIRRRRPFADKVHALLSALMREALRHVPGGYLCREQEGDLKYMVAFAAPRAALEWCLLVQEAAMYLDWPSSVLLHRAFASVHAPDGELLFRGPRLKMGLCEGAPKAVMPDCLGRADYHGNSINQAARYMDAGAHGGQVVCEPSVAARVAAEWAADAAAARRGSDGGSGGGAAAAAGAGSGSGGGGPSEVAPGDAARAQRQAQAPSALGSPATPVPVPTAPRPPPHQLPPSSPGSPASAFGGSSDGGYASAATAGWTPASSYDSVGALGDVSSAGNSFVAGSPPGRSAAGPPLNQRPQQQPQQQLQQQQQQQQAGARHSVPWPRSRFFRGLSGSRGSGGSSLGLAGRSPIPEDGWDPQRTQPASRPCDGAAASSAGVPRPLPLPPPPQQQQQQQRPPPPLAPAAAAARYALPDVPKSLRCVEVHRCGVFRFKGNPRPVELVHVTVAALSGRGFPSEAPKGKGARLEERGGLEAAVEAPLPALAEEYRSRVPAFILRRYSSGLAAAEWAAAGGAAGAFGGPGGGGGGPLELRTATMPARGPSDGGPGSGLMSRTASMFARASSLGSTGTRAGSGGSGSGGVGGRSEAPRLPWARRLSSDEDGKQGGGGAEEGGGGAQVRMEMGRMDRQQLQHHHQQQQHEQQQRQPAAPPTPSVAPGGGRSRSFAVSGSPDHTSVSLAPPLSPEPRHDSFVSVSHDAPAEGAGKEAGGGGGGGFVGGRVLGAGTAEALAKAGGMAILIPEAAQAAASAASAAGASSGSGGGGGGGGGIV